MKQNLLSEQVVEHLKELILVGDLDLGDSLPSEAELGARFGVSRAVVRDATRSLAAHGLVAVRQGKRPTVVGLNAGMAENFFNMVLRRDASAVMELIEVRRVLEVTNARLAAIHATEDDLQKMHNAIEVMKDKVREPLAYDKADLDFHEGLAAASGNRFLKLLIEALGEPLRASRIESRRGHALLGMDASRTIAGHQKILNTVAARDPEAAAHEMERHLNAAFEDLQAAQREASEMGSGYSAEEGEKIVS